MSKVAPALCSSYKGVLPSDLLEKYTCEGGWQKMEFDLAVVNEIHDQIKDSYGDSKKDVNAMQARKQQRRARRQAATIEDGEALQLLKDGGFIA